MTDKEENSKDYRIRPILTEEYNDKKKYDGKQSTTLPWMAKGNGNENQEIRKWRHHHQRIL